MPSGNQDDRSVKNRTAEGCGGADTSAPDGEEWVRFALAAARVGVWELDLKSDALKWSGTTALTFGLSPEHVPTTGRAFIELVHPDDRQALAENHDRAIRDRRDIVTEFRTISPDGVVRWIQAHGRALYNHVGTPLRMLGVNIDITDRKAFEAQLVEVSRHAERLRILKATMRTVQDIVCNSLMSLQFLHLETEPAVSTRALALFDEIIAETSSKLKALGDLEIVAEKDMAIGLGIDYENGPLPNTTASR